MASVIDEILEGKSPHPRVTAGAYAKHMRYVAERGLCKNYKPGALNKYEHKVTSMVLEGKLVNFVSADHQAWSSHLGADNKLFENQTAQKQQSQQQNPARGGFRGGRGGRGRGGWSQPTDICLKFNYSVCDFPQCIKYHICDLCRGQHRAKSCSLATAGQQGGYQQWGHGPPQGTYSTPPAANQAPGGYQGSRT